MTVNAFLQIALFFGIVLLLTKPVGAYMARVMQGERTMLQSVFGSLERLIYRLLGIDPEDDMKWTTYTLSLLSVSLVSLLFTYALLRLQGYLPLNPQGFGGKQMPPHLAFNTSVSFATNTNWQSYTPEQTVSYLSNMVALAIHNWLSAAVGICVAVALIRGFQRRSAEGVGNFWADCTRSTLYILLPLAFVAALVYAWQGVPQNFKPYAKVTTLQGSAQTIPMGPVASQEAIKILGTNGGGVFNANSAHPFENPNAFTDLLTKVLMFLIPAGLTYTFGVMVGNVRQGWAIFAAMSIMFLGGAFVLAAAEHSGNPAFASARVQTNNMEGKEARFGTTASALFATTTTDTSCGAVDSMHDSFTPIGGLVPLFNILTGEVIFGGVGCGLYGMLVFAIISVFIAGLMVGRTPEYLGKKIERFEVQMAMLAILILAAGILGFTALSANMVYPKTGPAAKLNTYDGSAYGGQNTALGPTAANTANPGAHGFSEILYAYSSAVGNNGSALAGINANTPHYNFTLALDMLVGRFLMMIPILAIAGSLARKKLIPVTSGTFRTDGATFAGLLIGVVFLVGVLTFFPALSLGPIVEHLQMIHWTGSFK